MSSLTNAGASGLNLGGVEKVAGNSSGNIPVNNGTLNANLNADNVDGLNANQIYSYTSYGVSWDESADTYARTGTLSSLACGATLTDQTLLTIQSKMRRCLVSDAGVVNYYLSSTNSNFKEDGVTASVLTGADGQVMVEIPKFYYQYSYIGTTHTWNISPILLSGYSVHPAFLQGSFQRDYIYVGAYEGVLYDTSASTYIDYTSAFVTQDWSFTGDKLSSVSGFKPASVGTRAQFRTIANNRGSNWTQLTYDVLSAVQLLYLTEYASFNSQSMIGPGISNVTDWIAYNGTYPISPTGNSNVIGNGTGNTAGGTTCAGEVSKYLSYRGIENAFGHIWKFIDGMNINNNVVYVNNDQITFLDDTTTNYTLIGTASNTNGYQNTLLEQSRGFLPLTVGATSSTKITDYYWQAAGWMIGLSGGDAIDGANDGFFYLNAYDGSSLSDPCVGSRLCFSKGPVNYPDLMKFTQSGNYGVAWNEVTDSYYRTGTLSYLAPATKPNESLLTIQSKMRRCLVSDAGVVNYYLNPTNSNFKEDGTPSVLTGADGQVMVEIPKFYYSYSFSNNTHTWNISPTLIAGYSVHPAFLQNGVERPYVYVGAYEGIIWSATTTNYVDYTSAYSFNWSLDKLSSVSGFKPASIGTRAQFRGAANNRGSNWTQLTYDVLSAVQLLYLTEYASFNSQSMIGPGISNVTDWIAYNGTYPISPTGNSNVIGNGTGNTAGGTTCAGEVSKYLSYRGIENAFGHIWKFIDGMNINNNVVYVNNIIANMADDTTTNYTLIGTASNTSGYQNTLLEQSRGFLPLTVGATSSTKITDYYWQAAGWMIGLSGGAADDGADDGFFSLNANNGSSLSNPSVGSRLCFLV